MENNLPGLLHLTKEENDKYLAAMKYAEPLNAEQTVALMAAFDEARAENKRLREALEMMLEHSCVADSCAEDKLPEDHAAESFARAALAPPSFLEGYCYDFSDHDMEKCWRASQANAEHLRILVHRLINEYDVERANITTYECVGMDEGLLEELRAASGWKAPETTEQGSPDGSPSGHQG